MKKTKTPKSLLRRMKKWLAMPGNTSQDLAVRLGYENGSVVRSWLNNQHVPWFQHQNIKEIMDGDNIR